MKELFGKSELELLQEAKQCQKSLGEVLVDNYVKTTKKPLPRPQTFAELLVKVLEGAAQRIVSENLRGLRTGEETTSLAEYYPDRLMRISVQSYVDVALKLISDAMTGYEFLNGVEKVVFVRAVVTELKKEVDYESVEKAGE